LYKFSSTTGQSQGSFTPKVLVRASIAAVNNQVGVGIWVCAGNLFLINLATGSPVGTMYVPVPSANTCINHQSMAVDGNGYVWWVSAGNSLLYRVLYEVQN